MEWRFYQPEDHALVAQWWKAWEWPVMPPESLPPIGFIISNEGHDVCAAWLYRTDSNIGWLEWYITNKSAPKSAKTGAIEYLIEIASETALQIGLGVLFSGVNHKNLIRKLESSGFKQTETGVTNFIKVLLCQ